MKRDECEVEREKERGSKSEAVERMLWQCFVVLIWAEEGLIYCQSGWNGPFGDMEPGVCFGPPDSLRRLFLSPTSSSFCLDVGCFSPWQTPVSLSFSVSLSDSQQKEIISSATQLPPAVTLKSAIMQKFCKDIWVRFDVKNLPSFHSW